MTIPNLQHENQKFSNRKSSFFNLPMHSTQKLFESGAYTNNCCKAHLILRRLKKTAERNIKNKSFY
jgi:hypothetical protein